jgi:putative nucleotidyltransferase with HDIG domain
MSALPNQQVAIDAVLAQVKDLAVLPQVVYKILELTGNPTACASQVEQAVCIDPGFSARVLKLVNSAYYSLSKPVGSIKDAVMFIGFKSLRQLAMTIGAFDMFMGKMDKGSMRRRLLWRHSLDTATVARELAARFQDVSPDEAHAAALLHDIGKSMLEQYGYVSYEAVESLMDMGISPLEAERQALGVDHCTMGMAVAAHWRFPSFLTECIGCHHVPGPDMDNPQLCAIIAIANAFAHLHSSKEEAVPRDRIPDWAANLLGLNDPAIANATYEECRNAIDQSAALAGAF